MRKSLNNIIVLLLIFLVALLFNAVFTSCRNKNDLDVTNETHTHNYGEWQVLKLETCNSDGERERYCSCGEKQTATISSTGHDYIVHDKVPASCTIDGTEEYRTCSRCDYVSEKITIPAYGHDIIHYFARQATCEQAGCTEYDSCMRCNYTTYIEVPAIGHDYAEWEVIVKPTCSTEGKEVRICMRDDSHVLTRNIEKSTHIPGEWIADVLPDCETDGLKHKECTVCRAVVQTQSIPATGHNYGNWQIFFEPTCTAKGEERRICNNDEAHVETCELDFAPHIEGDWIIDTAAVCETDGLKHKECTVCRAVIQTQSIPAIGHDYGNWETILEPTCSVKGEEKRTCSNDENHIETRELDFAPHTEGEWITVVAAVCEADGSRHTQCAVCNVILQTGIISATGHNYGDWIETTAPKCLEEGVRTKYCANDRSHTISETVEPLGHSFKWLFDKDKHYYTCERCKIQTESADHVWYEDKCTVCSCIKGPVEELAFVCEDGVSYSVHGLGTLKTADLVIPETYNGKPVTSIKSYAFRDCTQLKSIIVPDSVTKIGEGAFSGCSNVEIITLPFIGTVANANMYLGVLFGAENPRENVNYVPQSLNTVNICGNITEIADEAFYECKYLSSVILPETVERIGESAFSLCEGLKNITIPASVVYIGRFAFKGSGLMQAKFEVTQGWALYDGNEKLADLDDAVFGNGETAAQYLCYEAYYKYVWKRV